MPNPDPVAEALKTPEGQAAEALRIAKELEDKLNKTPEPPARTEGETPAEYRERVKAETGMTDKQIDFMEQTAAAASAAANENSAIADVKSRKADFSKFEKEIKEELALYSPIKRGDAKLIEKIYYMVKGKLVDSSSTRTPAAPIRGGSSQDTGLDNNGNNNSNEALDNEERYVARKMGLSEAEYAKSKTTRLIHELK